MDAPGLTASGGLNAAARKHFPIPETFFVSSLLPILKDAMKRGFHE